ncbi:MAG: S8 family serine peptidase, partial [Myxococcales bacterium]|nr:S8 family serine peptidase [Myxococcales bacterium]
MSALRCLGTALVVLLVFFCCPYVALSQSPSGQVVSSRAYALADIGGIHGPLAPILDASVSDEGFGGSIRFASANYWHWLPALEAAGVRFSDTGKPICLGRVCSAFVPFDALGMLETAPGVERVEPAWVPRERPLRDTAEPLGAYVAHAMGPERGLTGAGVIIGDLDSAIDFYHPSFFDDDGGLYDWFDLNHNGVFDVGEPIDYDGNGEASAGEGTSLLKGTGFWWDSVNNYWDNWEESYAVGQDWVYLDLNQNGRRDYGTASGFSEADPAYGEPLFVADDVNRNNRLDAGERFAALGSSKISTAVWGNSIYRRGVNLIESDDATTGGFDRHHGTGVAGILVGGQSGRLSEVGIAPDAELVSLMNEPTPDGDAELLGLAAAQDLGVDIVLHEFSSWTWVALDGSGNFELAMDTARGLGQLQVNPAGNLADSGKHTSVTMSDEPSEMEFDVPATYFGEPIGAVLMTLHWPATNEDVYVELEMPNGQVVELDSARG